MRVPREEFEAYLAPGESVLEGVPGTIVDGSYRSEGAIGLTDRRVLFVADGDRFLDVAHGAVSSIRSGPRTRFTAAGVGYPLLVAVGGLLAVAGLLAAVSLHPSPLGFGFATAAVAGAVAAEYVRRSGHGVDPDALDLLRRVLRGDASPSSGTLAALRPIRRGGPVGEGDNDALVLGVGLAALFALVGLVALAGSLLAVPLVGASLVGIACADYGYRRTRRIGASGRDRRRERDVRIYLVDGRVVDLRVDAADRIDRVLSGAVRAPTGGAATGPGHSPTTVSGPGR